jgi:hypothetical protein
MPPTIVSVDPRFVSSADGCLFGRFASDADGAPAPRSVVTCPSSPQALGQVPATLGLNAQGATRPVWSSDIGDVEAVSGSEVLSALAPRIVALARQPGR